TR
ncbi:hypothetical protein VCNHCC010F_003453B, partial [Vibrio cholerae O1 str. NHCC-010F]